MSVNEPFTKDNLDLFLKELAKEFRRLNGKEIPAEIILIGGASVLANYGFRDMTYDIDAVIMASSVMKEAINRIGDKFGLPNGWLNTDFNRTNSFSPKLIEFSKYYKKFSNVLTIRTIAAEYLIAMKLMSGRKYKNDISDIAGILLEHEKREKPITRDQIRLACTNLYGSFDRIPRDSASILEDILASSSLENLYRQLREEEKENMEELIEFEEKHPGETTGENVDTILKILQAKKNEQEKDQR